MPTLRLVGEETTLPSELDFADWVVEENLSLGQIKRLLQRPSFKAMIQKAGWPHRNPHGFRRLIEPDNGSSLQWHSSEIVIPEASGATFTVQHLDIIEVVRFLIGHEPFAPDLSYAPVREFNSDEGHIYSQPYTADHWWQIQEKMPAGATVVPILWMSDKTQVTQLRGDRSLHPCYVSILNLSNEARRQYTRPTILPVAFVPIIPRDHDNKDRLQQMIFHYTMDCVFRSTYTIDRI